MHWPTKDDLDTAKTGIGIVTAIAAGIGVVARAVHRQYECYVERKVLRRFGTADQSLDGLIEALRYYVPQECQEVDPANADEPSRAPGVRTSLFKALDQLVHEQSRYRHIMLLADSGMGKTTALLNYWFRGNRKKRLGFSYRYIHLGSLGSDDAIAKISDPARTVLLLDALDEDVLATEDVAKRMEQIVRLTRGFHAVIVSCRTQFFTSDAEIPKDTGLMRTGARPADMPATYDFRNLYLSPFDDAQIQAYLKKRYGFFQGKTRRQAEALIRLAPDLVARPMLLGHVDSLIHRKPETALCLWTIYEAMIKAWLVRERGFVADPQALEQFSMRMAVEMYGGAEKRGTEKVGRDVVRQLAETHGIGVAESRLTGRSLLNRDMLGKFKFSHRSIMEFLVVRAALAGVDSAFKREWTHQMHRFFWSALLDAEEHFDPIARPVDDPGVAVLRESMLQLFFGDLDLGLSTVYISSGKMGKVAKILLFVFSAKMLKLLQVKVNRRVGTEIFGVEGFHNFGLLPGTTSKAVATAISTLEQSLSSATATAGDRNTLTVTSAGTSVSFEGYGLLLSLQVELFYPRGLVEMRQNAGANRRTLLQGVANEETAEERVQRSRIPTELRVDDPDVADAFNARTLDPVDAAVLKTVRSFVMAGKRHAESRRGPYRIYRPR